MTEYHPGQCSALTQCCPVLDLTQQHRNSAQLGSALSPFSVIYFFAIGGTVHCHEVLSRLYFDRNKLCLCTKGDSVLCGTALRFTERCQG